jgi:hypothetical protein
MQVVGQMRIAGENHHSQHLVLWKRDLFASLWFGKVTSAGGWAGCHWSVRALLIWVPLVCQCSSQPGSCVFRLLLLYQQK